MNTRGKNSFIPYGRQNIEEKDIEAVCNVLTSDYLTTGPKIQEFEKHIADFCKSKFAVAVTNGTAALHLASICLLQPGDQVLTTPNSFLATSNAILYSGAEPVFVDIANDGNIDLDLCEKELSKNNKIKALYAVHFSGNPLKQEKLRELKATYTIKILEDCSHAIGGVYTDSNENKIMSASCMHSDISTLSFHPVKHLTTGEGGAITTNDEVLYQKLLILRNHGMVQDQQQMLQLDYATDESGAVNPWYYEMQMLGFNYRITDIQCALGIQQIDRLDKFVSKRKKLAKIYDRAFAGLDWVRPLYLDNDFSSYHLYVLRFNFNAMKLTRSQLFAKLRERKVGVQVHYIPINKQPFYRKLGYGSELTPEMDSYYAETVSIPMYYGLTFGEQQYVIECIKEVVLN